MQLHRSKRALRVFTGLQTFSLDTSLFLLRAWLLFAQARMVKMPWKQSALHFTWISTHWRLASGRGRCSASRCRDNYDFGRACQPLCSETKQSDCFHPGVQPFSMAHSDSMRRHFKVVKPRLCAFQTGARLTQRRESSRSSTLKMCVC